MGENETEVGQEATTEEATTEAKTYRQEELDAFVKAAKEEEFEKYQGIQRTVTQKDRRIKELESQTSNPSDTLPLLEKLADGDPEVLAQVAQLRRQKETEATFTYQRQVSTNEREKIDKKITDAGLDPDDAMFSRAEIAFNRAADMTGDFTRANELVDKILAKQKPTKPEDKETDEAKEERLRREIYEKEGLNVPEKVTPSASGKGIPKKMGDFREWVAALSYEQYKELKPDIDAMMQKGEIQ